MDFQPFGDLIVFPLNQLVEQFAATKTNGSLQSMLNAYQLSPLLASTIKSRAWFRLLIGMLVLFNCFNGVAAHFFCGLFENCGTHICSCPFKLLHPMQRIVTEHAAGFRAAHLNFRVLNQSPLVKHDECNWQVM